MPVPEPSGAVIRDLPGFYYDAVKKRYFKIESARTAPPEAAWSAENVKKRKAERQAVERKARRQEKTKHLIKRSGALTHPQTGGQLAREFGTVDPELPVESWAAGLRDKGGISFAPDQERTEDAANLSCMFVNGDDEASGLGVAYATRDGHHVIGSYIPTDKDEKINFAQTYKMRASRLAMLRTEPIYLPEITSMSYHKPSHNVVVTSTNLPVPNGGTHCQVCIFQPQHSSHYYSDSDSDERSQWYFRRELGGEKPAWLLGASNIQVIFASPVRGLSINSTRTCRTSPSGHLSVLLATSNGIAHLAGTGDLDDIHWVKLGPDDNDDTPDPRDVLSVDFHPSNGHVFYAGSRDSKLHRADLRAPPGASGWGWSRHRSSAAHVRCLDDHQLLAAGPRSAMAIYDVRWGGRGWRGEEASPVVRFPGYRNAAHVRIGLDVTHDVGGVGGLGCGGVVAAALDDGSVGIFSLRTGRRLAAGDVDDPARLKAVGGGVVKALQFEKMPSEKGTSLFVGVGPVLKKFSFGLGDNEEEW